LYQNGAENDITTQNNDGYTPMYAACCNQQLEHMKWLYDRGAVDDVSRTNFDGDNCMTSHWWLVN